MPIIAIEGMKFYAYHGYYTQENKIGGYFVVDVYVETEFADAAKEDLLAATINYEEIYQICAEEMKKTAKLIETVAYGIFFRIKDIDSNISGLRVRLSKLKPPLGGEVERTFVEIAKKF